MCLLPTLLFAVFLIFVNAHLGANPHSKTKSGPANPPPVSSLDITSFSGSWIQMTASIIPNVTYERDCYCNTANFEVNSGLSNTLNFTLGCRMYSSTGSIVETNGNLIQSPVSTGEFTMTFASCEFCPTLSSIIRVVAVGTVDSSSQYPWAIIVDGNYLSVYVLARDANTYYSTYETEVTSKLTEFGFTTCSLQPMPTYQGSECSSTSRRASNSVYQLLQSLI